MTQVLHSLEFFEQHLSALKTRMMLLSQFAMLSAAALSPCSTTGLGRTIAYCQEMQSTDKVDYQDQLENKYLNR